MEDRPLDTLDDGAKALLEQTVAVLQNFEDCQYIIIGGWCPVLRSNSDIAHPGTLDVDILFEDSDHCGQLSPVVKSLFSEGFMPSAKHSFQLLKPIEINTSRVVFHIDLLHPDMTKNKKSVGMFVDHLDLDVPITQEEDRVKKMASIVLPNSRVLFDEQLFDRHPLGDLDFNLLTFEGMFLTKMDSCSNPKRTRDSFDIFLAFVNEAIDMCRINELASRNHRVQASLENFTDFLNDPNSTFDKNVNLYAKSIDQSPTQFILSRLES